MPAALADSTLYRGLFGDADAAEFFTETAEIRAMLRVEGALATVQAALGLIPVEAATFIQRVARDARIDPATLANETTRNAVPVPALLAAFRATCGNPDHAQYLHWGATSQDIIDTGLALRLRGVIDLWDKRLDHLIAGLGILAATHADLPMAARTYGQIATPTSFGAVVAGWGRPLLAHRAGLVSLRAAVLKVSLGGAAGTLSAMGPKGPQVREGLAQVLELVDPGHSWHSERDGMAALAAWMAGLTGSLGKMGEDLILLTQSGMSEVMIAGAGASSTMPQKQNPVGPSVLVALARHVIALSVAMQGAALHRQNRDGAAWFTEWLTLPQMCISTSRALALADGLAGAVTPDPNAMARGLAAHGGTIQAEALSFTLSEHLPRNEAQALIKALCREAEVTNTPLRQLLARDFPMLDWTDHLSGVVQLGQAPDEANAFARIAAEKLT